MPDAADPNKVIKRGDGQAACQCTGDDSFDDPWRTDALAMLRRPQGPPHRPAPAPVARAVTRVPIFPGFMSRTGPWPAREFIRRGWRCWCQPASPSSAPLAAAGPGTQDSVPGTLPPATGSRAAWNRRGAIHAVHRGTEVWKPAETRMGLACDPSDSTASGRSSYAEETGHRPKRSQFHRNSK